MMSAGQLAASDISTIDLLVMGTPIKQGDNEADEKDVNLPVVGDSRDLLCALF